tara:strand:+ start:535 stop:714 length:180 start_codon:yes stop_codon:yes gene_type:complete
MELVTRKMKRSSRKEEHRGYLMKARRNSKRSPNKREQERERDKERERDSYNIDKQLSIC